MRVELQFQHTLPIPISLPLSVRSNNRHQTLPKELFSPGHETQLGAITHMNKLPLASAVVGRWPGCNEKATV